MLALDYILPRILTPAAINAKIALLNSEYAPLSGYTACPTLDSNSGVINVWAVAWANMEPPVVGYEVGFLREGRTEIVLQGKNRDEYQVFITAVAKSADELIARQQAAVIWEAVRMVLDDPTSAGLEGQQLPGVTPVRGIVKIGPAVMTEVVTVDVAAAGKKLGFRSRWLMTMDTVRS